MRTTMPKITIKKKNKKKQSRESRSCSFRTGGLKIEDEFLSDAARASDVKFDGRDILMFTE